MMKKKFSPGVLMIAFSFLGMHVSASELDQEELLRLPGRTVCNNSFSIPPKENHLASPMNMGFSDNQPHSYSPKKPARIQVQHQKDVDCHFPNPDLMTPNTQEKTEQEMKKEVALLFPEVFNKTDKDESQTGSESLSPSKQTTNRIRSSPQKSVRFKSSTRISRQKTDSGVSYRENKPRKKRSKSSCENKKTRSSHSKKKKHRYVLKSSHRILVQASIISIICLIIMLNWKPFGLPKVDGVTVHHMQYHSYSAPKKPMHYRRSSAGRFV